MGLSDAKRVLQWRVVTEALAEANVDAEIVAIVEHARAVDETVYMMARGLLGGADAKQVKNYIKVELVGMTPPFERAYVELVKPGGKTSHELRELMRDMLIRAGAKLRNVDAEFDVEIDELLKLEAP
jgi:hypothetical protein